MFEIIEKLRQKPDGVKKRIAFLVAFSLSGIIFVLWVAVIYPDFKHKQLQKENVANLTPGPLSSFGSTISDGFSSIGEQFSKIKDSVTSISKEIEEQSIASSTEPELTIIEL